MSGLRLLVTGAAMAGVAAVLRLLAPLPLVAVETLRNAQHVATSVGPESVVLAAAGLAAWLAWAWGALGLLLTAASALPGAAGAAARCTGRIVLPASIRSSAAVALGIGLVVAPTAIAQATPPSGVASAGPVPDWPADTGPADTGPADTGPADTGPADTGPADAPVPDWPPQPPDPSGHGPHVVAPGDYLWAIADARLRRAGDPSPTDGAVATAVAAWWQTNRAVIGPDPDLIHPGQVLQAPAVPPAPTTPGEPR